MRRSLPLAFLSLVAVVCLGFFAVAMSRADDAKPAKPADPAKVSFFRDVRPIFQERCQGCHQSAKALGGFVVTSFDALKKGGESAVAGVVPGKPDDSEILSQLLPSGDTPPAMPKGAPPLKAEQVDMIRRWIAEGAVDDTPPSTEPVIDMQHPPTYTALPVLTSLDYSPDGTLLAVSGYHEVLLHRADGSGLAGRLVGLSERIESARFSPDGKMLAVSGGSPGRFGEVQIWDVAEKKLKQSIPVTFDTVYGVSWSPDGTKVAFGCADNTCRAVEAATGKQVFFQGAHNDWVLDTVFSVDGAHLVSVSRDRSMKLNEVATERFVDNITSITPGALKGGLIAVDRHPKREELLVGGADGAPKIYQMHRTKARVIGDDFNLIRAFEAMPGRIFSVRYSPDGTRVLAGSSSDGQGEARVYNEADAKQISRFAEQHGAIYTVAWRPEGKEVATGGFDGVIRVYNPDDGKLVREFMPAPIAGAAAAATASAAPATPVPATAAAN
ncbi:MAG TPA: c-type cytochrome domain-containing protein [Pirellulales bacterium]|jgi:dipeptidyl aminopeptidase/acylaminoacyl peptidase